MEREIVHYSDDDKKIKDKSIDSDHSHRIEGEVVKFADIGAKVKRGPDWEYSDQDKDAVYGIITYECKVSPGYFNVMVGWVKKTEDSLSISNSFAYRAGEVGDQYTSNKKVVKYDLVYADQNL